MRGLADLTGQSAAIARAIELASLPERRRLTIVGPPGSGVSWTLDELARRLPRDTFAPLVLRGDAAAADRPLYPWLRAAGRAARELELSRRGREGFVAGAASVPAIGPFAAFLVDEVVNARTKRAAQEARILSDVEQEVLALLDAHSGGRRLVLLCDDVDAWDPTSRELLRFVLGGELDSFYPALLNLCIVYGRSGVTAKNPERGDDNAERTEDVCELHRVPTASLEDALRTLGFSAGLTVAQRDELAALTSGRIDLLTALAQLLRAGGGLDWNEAGVSSDVARLVIDRALASLPPDAAGVDDLLARAAILGTQFDVSDLRCLAKRSSDVVGRELAAARAAGLIGAGPAPSFATPLHREAFLERFRSRHPDYHAQFAQCLRVLRPHEYEARSNHALLGLKDEEAITTHAQAVLASWREHRPRPNSDPFNKLESAALILAYLDKMKVAQDAYSRRDIDAVLRALETIESFLPDVLIAERDHLHAQALLKLHNVTSYDAAEKILARWDRLKAREAELWARMAQARLVALTELDRIDDARHIEAELSASFFARRSIDPAALAAYHTLCRRAASLHELPTSNAMLAKASDYFGPLTHGAVPRNRIQYYYALNNHVANLLASGSFDEARAEALTLEELLRAFPAMTWPCVEIAATNAVLAGYLTSNLTAQDAHASMKTIVGAAVGGGDMILMRVNLAVFAILAGELASAEHMLFDLERETAHATTDSYHRYFVTANRASLAHVLGKQSESQLASDEARRCIGDIYPPIRRVLAARQDTLDAAFANPATISVSELNASVRSIPPQVGPEWNFFGRAFLFSDIQFWSAD